MKNFAFLFTLLALLGAPLAHAVSPTEAEVKDLLNYGGNEGIRRAQLGTQVVSRKIQLLSCKWDFAVQGGAVSTINLKDIETGKDCTLPNKAIVTQVYTDTITAVTTSASGTLSIDANTTGDLKAALAAASWSGIQAGVPVGTAATMVKLTANRTITATIATGALTAGKINVHIQYVAKSE